MAWTGLSMMGLQFGILARLTWWDYSWDVMEPVTYFVTYGTAMAMFSYYIVTNQVWCFKVNISQWWICEWGTCGHSTMPRIQDLFFVCSVLLMAESALKRTCESHNHVHFLFLFYLHLNSINCFNYISIISKFINHHRLTSICRSTCTRKSTTD